MDEKKIDNHEQHEQDQLQKNQNENFDLIKYFVFFDTETTDLLDYNFFKSNITELTFYGCSRESILNSKFDYNDNKNLNDVKNVELPRIIHKLNLCFNPAKQINHESSQISGLINEMLEYENKFDKNAGNLIINFLKHLPHPLCLVAHNGIKFDFPILKMSLDKVNVDVPEFVLCIDSLDAIKYIDDIKNTKLQENNDIKDKELLSSLNLEIILNENELNKNHQILNETTPKRKIKTLNNILNVKKHERFKNINRSNNESETDSDEDKPTLKKLNKSEIKSRKELFPSISNKNFHNKSILRNLISSSSSSRFASSSLNTYKKTSYKLDQIYERIFGIPPSVSHQAENDVITLQKIVISMGKEFVNYADKNAQQLLKISTKPKYIS